ncbi:hypothetical protein ACOMHN_039549 [Nucella lapillus]
MGLQWTIACLFCSLVLGSDFGDLKVFECKSGEACDTMSSTTSYGGKSMCCPDGYFLRDKDSFFKGKNTKRCHCTSEDLSELSEADFLQVLEKYTDKGTAATTQ